MVAVSSAAWTVRVYETCLSAGSTAENWSPHPEWTSQVLQVGCPKKGSSLRETRCTELPPIPMERIAENALGAFQMQSEECRLQNGGHLGFSVCFHSHFCILHLNRVSL